MCADQLDRSADRFGDDYGRIIKLLAHPRVFGRENLHGVKGPLLVICNHVIYLDVGFVLAALPLHLRHRLAVAMGGERLAQMCRPPKEWPFLRRFFQRMDYFLVDTSRPLDAALREYLAIRTGKL